MKMIKIISLAIFGLILTNPILAERGPEESERHNDKVVAADLEVNFREDCEAAEKQIDLDVNNVRARLLTGGDLWWDLDNGRYVVPNVPIGSGLDEVSSLFAAGIWLGGLDPVNNLKLAASLYRNNGRVDYYTGPLFPDGPEQGQTTSERCNQWDEFFVVDGEKIRQAVNLYNDFIVNPEAGEFPCDSLSEGIINWPGKGNNDNFPGNVYNFSLPNTGQGLASFWDDDEDGDYNPCAGDFPIIDIRGCEPFNRDQAVELIPDQMIFWIYNDAGNSHNLTQGAALNMEVQVQAFAYATNDEINDMTFYRYKLINRGLQDLRNTYFALWVDPDLGCSEDDYIGCDVERSLAYTYNEDILDGATGCECPGGVNTYCDKIPIIGTDYFRGPLSPHEIVTDGVSNVAFEHEIKAADQFYDDELYSIGDTILVKPIQLGSQGEGDIFIELGMSSFVYHNRGGLGAPTETEDPGLAEEYYNYLQGLWRFGTPITQGGSGYTPGSIDTVSFVFPGEPDDNANWSMCSADLPFGDRRTIQASGPFLLQPGDVNELILGAVWVPDLTYPCPDISRLQAADDLAQALFDNCFDLIDGPDAPDMCAIELDRQVVLVLSNDSILSNNAFEEYQEIDIFAPKEIADEDKTYVFEGYKIFQLADGTVSPQELSDIDRARIVRQVDLKNGVTELYNWDGIADPNPAINELVWTFETEVEGLDEGIKNTFIVTEDAFAAGDRRLVNHTKYYFMVIAYAYNNFETFDPKTGTGQRTTYLEGRKNISVLTVTPRPISYANQNAEYGDGAIVTRLDGVGVGGNFVEIDDTMYDKILNGEVSDGEVVYKEGAGPISVKIYNPLEVKDGTYELEILGDHTNSPAICALSDDNWRLTNVDDGSQVISERPISQVNEQILPEYGFSITVEQTEDAGSDVNNNGYIGERFDYADDEGVNWYTAIQDDGRNFNQEDLFGFLGVFFNFMQTSNNEADFLRDPQQNYSEGLFYPFTLAAGRAPDPTTQAPYYITPGYKRNNFHGFIADNNNDVDKLNNIDIVMTSDKSKWSRCIVIETATEDYTATANTIGNASTFDLRQSPSVNQEGQEDGDGIGMGWFPGYAVDVETGKRLNIFFGENSVWNENNADLLVDGVPIGADMLYNPTSQLIALSDNVEFQVAQDWVVGGNHNIYATRTEYDGCAELRSLIGSSAGGAITPNRIAAYRAITWCSMTLLMPDVEMNSIDDGLIPADVTVKLRVDNPYNLEEEYVFVPPPSCDAIGSNPKYRFEIRNKALADLEDDQHEGALAEANVVPNPYYGYSAYETSQLTTTVKITNLPERADITIFSLDGKFIREFRRDERGSLKGGSNPGINRGQGTPDVEWDLKNHSGVPIASGVYLIHIAAPELGEERTIKWFGVNRQFDPSGL